MDIKDSVLSIAGNYDTFFVDIYGVLFNGVTLYDQVLVTLEKLKKIGKKIVILSNTTQISSEAKIGYGRRGMLENVHYDKFLTSGEFLHHIMSNDQDKFCQMIGKCAVTVKCMFMGNWNVFDGTNLKKVDTYDADFLYVGVPRASYGAVRIDDVLDSDKNKVNMEDVISSDWNTLQDSHGRKGFAEFAHQLENCLSKNKILLVANPDIFAHASSECSQNHMAIITQGAIGAYYEKLGGKVVYFGKPYSGIFNYAKQLENSSNNIVMIGDTPWTDISGANLSGIDSALVTTTGVTNEFLEKMDASLTIDKKFEILFGKIAQKMSKSVDSVHPKHFIKRFAHIK